MKLINHLKTINKHKYYVTMLCFKCGLYKQGLLHDLSKYSPTELKTGAKYWVGTRSPNSIERETKGKEWTRAILRHGYIIKEEINIIGNIGLIFQEKGLFPPKCLQSMLWKCFVIE